MATGIDSGGEEERERGRRDCSCPQAAGSWSRLHRVNFDLDLGIGHLEGRGCICFWCGESREEQKGQTRLWGGKGADAAG